MQILRLLGAPAIAALLSGREKATRNSGGAPLARGAIAITMDTPKEDAQARAFPDQLAREGR